MSQINLHHADMLEWLTTYAERIAAGEVEPFDSCCTDPPYHLTSIVKRFGKEGSAAVKVPVDGDGAYARASRGFMGKQWDGGDIAQRPQTWRAVFECLKPGAHLIAFAHVRTYHRMACAIEDAGFEIRDCIMWHYGSGFPKSHNVLKQLQSKGFACTCRKSILSHHHATEQNLRRLQEAVDARDEVSSRSESDLQREVQGAAYRAEGEGQTCAQQDESDSELRGLRHPEGNPSGVAQAGKEPDLQQTMQRGAARQGVGGARPQGAEGADAGELSGVSHGGSEEPCLARRRDPGQNEGELQGRQVRSSAAMGPADGTEGRIHSGAQAGDVSDVRVSPDADRGGQSHRSQHREQPSLKSGTLADERGSQTWGGWPVCDGCGKPIIPEGFGTALKPATEPICLARKPLIGTVAANLAEHGTGALNIDGCRIGDFVNTTPPGTDRYNAALHEQGYRPSAYGRDGEASAERRYTDKGSTNFAALPGHRGGAPEGRWPANIIHDGSEEVEAAFPDSNGQQGIVTGNEPSSPFANVYGDMPNRAGEAVPRGDSGSAARFFYSAKAGPLDRMGTAHATVKPVDLMRWLTRLVTPPGGHVLDPFAGSGTTGIACMAEGFDCTLIELEAAHHADIERKLAVLRGDGRMKFIEHDRRRDERAKESADNPLPLFGGAAA